MYTLTIFGKDFDSKELEGTINDPETDVTVHDGVLIAKDTDNDYLILPVENFGYASAVQV